MRLRRKIASPMRRIIGMQQMSTPTSPLPPKLGRMPPAGAAPVPVSVPVPEVPPPGLTEPAPDPEEGAEDRALMAATKPAPHCPLPNCWFAAAFARSTSAVVRPVLVLALIRLHLCTG